MRRRLERLLAIETANPDVHVEELDLLSDGDRDRLLRVWNDTGREAAEGSFPELFEARVRRTPDAPALVAVDARLSYTELDARANRLARELLTRGAVPDRFVALCLPRTSDLVVALLVERRFGEPAPSWQRGPSLRWHDGATRGSSVVAAAYDDGRWILVHRLGDVTATAKKAKHTLRTLTAPPPGEDP